MARRLKAIILVGTFLSSLATEAKVMPAPRPSGNQQIFTHKAYDLNACSAHTQKHDLGAAADLVNEHDCGLAKNESFLTPAVQAAKATFSAVEEEMLEGFRKHLVNKIGANQKLNGAIMNCFRGEKPPEGTVQNNDCAGVVARSKEIAARDLPVLRRQMAMMSPDRVPENTNPKQMHSGSKYTLNIKHPFFGGKPAPLTPGEAKAAADEFDKDVEVMRQEFLKEQAKTYDCITKKGEEFVLPDSRCTTLIGGQGAINQGIYRKMYGNRSKHREAYETLLSNAPHLAFFNGASVNSSDADKLMANAYGELEKKMGEEVARLNGLKKSDLKSLVAYKSEFDAYLKTVPNVPKAYCDVAQTLLDQKSFNDAALSVGLGAAALVGTGLCVVTMGAGCAGSMLVGSSVAGVVASEAALIARAKTNYQQAVDRYIAGSISIDELRAAEANLNTEIGMAPAALIGSGVVGTAMKQSNLAVRAQMASSNRLSGLWTRQLSKEQATSLSAKVSKDATMKAEYNRLTSQMTDLVKSKTEAVPPALQDRFMTNINKAVADLKDGEVLNIGLYRESLEKVAAAKPNTAAARAALKELDHQTEILRYVNAQSGNSVRDKVDRFLATVSLKLKRISPADAQIFKSCIIANKGVSLVSPENRPQLACWKPSAREIKAN